MVSCRLLPCLSMIFAPLAIGCGARTGLIDADRGAGDGGLNDASSDGSADQRRDAAVPTTCPAWPPMTGEGCAVLGQVCGYFTGKAGSCDDVGLEDRVAWRCEDTGWLEIARCVSWADCPDEAPAQNSPCSEPQTGLDCFYSSSDCASSSIAQCDGVRWNHVNACPSRVKPEAFQLVATQPEGALAAVEHTDRSVTLPSIALAGTQMLMAYRAASALMQQEHAINGHFLQTAAPVQSVLHVSSDADLMGENAISNPQVVCHAGRFMLAWGALWWASSPIIHGAYTRTIPRDGQPEAAHEAAWGQGVEVTSLTMQPGGGRLAYRSDRDDGRHIASVMPISEQGDSLWPKTEGMVLADEGESDWNLPVPYAFVRTAAWKDGFVHAYPFRWSDDAGLALAFYSGVEPLEAPNIVRLPVQVPLDASVVPLRDGSVVVAYRREGDPEGGVPFHLVQVWVDGTWSELEDPPQFGDERLGFGPVATPFEGGFAVAWTSLSSGSSAVVGSPRVLVQVGEGLSTRVMWAGDEVQGLLASDWLALEFGRVDRTLHLAWSRASGKWRVIDRQRLIVRPL